MKKLIQMQAASFFWGIVVRVIEFEVVDVVVVVEILNGIVVVVIVVEVEVVGV